MQSVKRLALGVALICLPIILAVSVFAQTEGGSGLSISPLHNRMSLKPGDSKQITITLKNITAGPIVAKPYVNDFMSNNIDGKPIIITDPNKRSPNSIRDFVSGLENVPLAVGEQKKVTVSIKAPQSVSPGAYYGIIRYQAIPSTSGEIDPGQVSLSASVGTIVLAQIEGDLVEKLQLLNLYTYTVDKKNGSLVTTTPDSVGVELRNFGNAFAQPFGRVVIENMSGKEVYSYELNSANPRSSVLPGTKRTFKDKIKNISTPGRYNISASVSYGSGSDVLVMQKHFWYLPVWFLAILIAVLAALIFAVVKLLRRNSSRNKRLKKRR